jgi:cysteinyl-tRNA synthetase, unknown class
MLERLLKLVCGAAMVLALCAVSSGGDDPFGARSAQASYAVPNDFVYQLQNVNLSAIGKTKFDLVVMDYSRDGSDERKFSAEEIEALKTSPGGRKRVLAYMSIGEAEDYRFYWQRSWDADRNGRPDSGAPAWLEPSNPEWPGNYKVRYWDPAW